MSEYVYLHTNMALPQTAAVIGSKVVYIYTTHDANHHGKRPPATTTPGSRNVVTPAWAPILTDGLFLYIGHMLM